MKYSYKAGISSNTTAWQKCNIINIAQISLHLTAINRISESMKYRFV